MQQITRLSTQEWIDKLAREELPAITSIASVLDKFSNDDVSSIPKLSRAILHDQALSSCLLRVANSSHRSPVHKVTTVSRAAIVLGIHAVKNICLTAKILDKLLDNKNLVPEVYDRLMTLMANAFYAGLLARIMVPDYDENTQEEVYLAAMMYHIGETSFWSTGSNLTRELIKKSAMPADEFEKYCEQKTGVRFTELSKGLARTWGLGELLIKSLDNPQTRTVEVQIISLSNQLTSAIANSPTDRAKLDRILKDMAGIMKIDVAKLKKRIETTRQHAIELLGSYGVPMLESYIRPLPKGNETPAPAPAAQAQANSEIAMLTAIKELNELTKVSTNINAFLSTALKNCAVALGFRRCTFWILSADRGRVEARISFDNTGQSIIFNRSIPLGMGNNVISHTIQNQAAQFIDDYKHVKWRDYLTPEIEQLINRGQLCLAPVRIGIKDIGLVSAQSNETISQQSFEHFSMLTDHLNMCLNLVSQRRNNG